MENSDAVLPWVASLDDTACSYYDSTNVNSKFAGASWVMFGPQKSGQAKTQPARLLATAMQCDY